MIADAIDRIRLLRSERVGPVGYRQLLRRFGSARAALEALPELSRRRGGSGVRIASEREAEAEMRATEAAGAHYLFHDDAAYPALLEQLDNAPPILMLKGDAGLLDRPAIAMVGARNASAAARRFAATMASELAEAGYVVASGLARGIDTAAHRGALGQGRTIGVIASGIDIAYPPENRELQAEMGEKALVIAEQPPGAEPLARHFPFRNRIIAGLSLATLVVEAAPRSGSLITARLAAEAGREVMAVPGSPLDPRSQGCNGLIREGATLVENTAQILELVRPIDPAMVRAPVRASLAESNGTGGYAAEEFAHDPDSDRAVLLDLLSPTPVTVDELIQQGNLPAASVHAMLLEMELLGEIERNAGGKVSRA